MHCLKQPSGRARAAVSTLLLCCAVAVLVTGCSKDESADQTTAACDAGTSCDPSTDAGLLADADVATDAGHVPCMPGDQRCVPTNSLVVQRCSAEGVWLSAPSCDPAKLQRCAAGVCKDACEVSALLHEHTGCTFWTTDLDNAFVPGGKKGYYDAAGATYVLAVANPSDVLGAKVTVHTNEGPLKFDVAGNPLDTSPIKPGDVRYLRLPPRNINGTVQAKMAYRLTSTTPISVHQYNPLTTDDVFSNDSSLVLPLHALGQEHLVVIREQSISILKTYVTVVAVEPGETKVSLTLSASASKTFASTIGSPIPSMKGGGSASFTLAQWDTLNIETDARGADLTGSEVLSTQRVAVWAGSEGSYAPNTDQCDTQTCSAKDLANNFKCGVCADDKTVPCYSAKHCSHLTTCCADHLEAQMPPVPTWGSRHVAVKLYPRGKESDLWRIIAGANDTTVTLDPPLKDVSGQVITIPKLQRGQWHEIETPESFEIVAKRSNGKPAPVLIGHFMAGQDAPGPNTNGPQKGDAGTGDPTLLRAVPVEQWARRYVFESPKEYATNCISIAAPAGAKVTMDGVALEAEVFTLITAQTQMARFVVPPGVHVVTSAVPIGLEVYGFQQYVSYGHAAGGFLRVLGH